MIKVRKYKNNDWARLCQIHDAARMDELQGSVDLRAFKTLEATFKNEGLFDDELLVAIYDHEVNGFIAYDRTEITWLYVDPKYYRKGIGSVLLRAALDHCEGSVVAEVLSGNLKAISFYKNQGFKIVDKKEGVLEGNEDFKAEGFIMSYKGTSKITSPA